MVSARFDVMSLFDKVCSDINDVIELADLEVVLGEAKDALRVVKPGVDNGSSESILIEKVSLVTVDVVVDMIGLMLSDVSLVSRVTGYDDDPELLLIEFKLLAYSRAEV